MVGGFLVTVGWVVIFKARFHDLYEMIPGFAAGLLLTVLVSLFTRPPEGAAEELRSVSGAIGGPFGGDPTAR
jgi:sodium/proline symporter